MTPLNRHSGRGSVRNLPRILPSFLRTGVPDHAGTLPSVGCVFARSILRPLCRLPSHEANAQKDANPDLKAIANGNNQFACDLYHRLQAAKGNLFFSPNSISTALAMTYGGAKADTAQQMATVLHFDLPQNQLQQAFAALAAAAQRQ